MTFENAHMCRTNGQKKLLVIEVVKDKQRVLKFTEHIFRLGYSLKTHLKVRALHNKNLLISRYSTEIKLILLFKFVVMCL